MGSNHRHLACKAENGTEYAQLPGSAHAADLRKPCPEMPSGAWESLHGGSRKWFPEQLADPRLKSELGSGGKAIGVHPPDMRIGGRPVAGAVRPDGDSGQQVGREDLAPSPPRHRSAREDRRVVAT